MKRMKLVLAAFLCCAICGVWLTGCHSGDANRSTTKWTSRSLAEALAD